MNHPHNCTDWSHFTEQVSKQQASTLGHFQTDVAQLLVFLLAQQLSSSSSSLWIKKIIIKLDWLHCYFWQTSRPYWDNRYTCLNKPLVGEGEEHFFQLLLLPLLSAKPIFFKGKTPRKSTLINSNKKIILLAMVNNFLSILALAGLIFTLSNGMAFDFICFNDCFRFFFF